MVFGQFLNNQGFGAAGGGVYQIPPYDDDGVIVAPGHPLYDQYATALEKAGYSPDFFNDLPEDWKVSFLKRAWYAYQHPSTGETMPDYREPRTADDPVMTMYAGMDHAAQAHRHERLDPFMHEGMGAALGNLFGGK